MPTTSADNPAIVDGISLAREYERIGYRSPSPHGRAFDTRAAVETGRLVAEELGNRAATVATR